MRRYGNWRRPRGNEGKRPGNGDNPCRSSSTSRHRAGGTSFGRQPTKRGISPSRSSISVRASLMTSSQPSNGERRSPGLARMRWTRTCRRSRTILNAERLTTDNAHLSGRQQRLMAAKREVTTMREYLRVTPTSERLNPERLPQALESLHKLTSADSAGLVDKLNPLHSDTPLRFEFLALSEGTDDPVEFYYGADDIWIPWRNGSSRSIPRRSTSSVPRSTSHPDSYSLSNSTARHSSSTMSQASSRTSSALTSNTRVALTTTVKRGQGMPNQSRMEARSATSFPTTSSRSAILPSNSPHQMRFPRMSHSRRLPNQR